MLNKKNSCQVKKTIQPGDWVSLVSSGQVGKVVKVWKKKVIIHFDYMVLTVSCEQVEQLSTASQTTVNSEIIPKNRWVKSLHFIQTDFGYFNTEIDLHGMQVTEALRTLDKWLDKAAVLGHKHLRVIHGIGRGILRKEIRKYLHCHDLVRKVIVQHAFQGGGGVTGIELY